MPARRDWKVAALLTRIPVAALGVVIAASALQASCNGTVDEGPADARADAASDSPSQDSPTDRADGMSYGDAYGGMDAHHPDANACMPGAKRCAGNGVETCQADGEWGTAVACDPATPVCQGGVCVPPPPACSPTCPTGNECSANGQCATGVCTGGTCAAPVCSPTCGLGDRCGANGDCASGACASYLCAPPFCSPTCAAGHGCGANGDCASAVCTDGTCAAPACSPTCAAGVGCGANGDCASAVCENGVCAASACQPTCPDGVSCGGATDCASGVCTGGKCASPACAPGCAAGSVCGANDDCASDVCLDGACTVHSYTIGGTVSGLSGIGLVLSDNGGDSLAVTANGSYVFATPVASGQPYLVTVSTQPAGQSCYVRSAAGTVGSAPVTSIDVVCRSGLVAYYPFDEGSGTTVHDVTGNGNDGTTDASYVPGMSGTALAFNGDTSAIVIGNAAFTWGAANADYTVDYWVSLTATNANWMSPFHKSDVAGGNCCNDWERSPAQFFRPGSTQLATFVATSSDGNFNPPNYPSFTLGKWTHYAAVHSGRAMLIYIDGVQVGPAADLPSDTVGGQGKLNIGNDGYYSGLDGRMDEVRIYDVALSAAQVQADMN